jgi:ribosomal protein L37AE/L43A
MHRPGRALHPSRRGQGSPEESLSQPEENTVTNDVGQRCPACDSGRTYWAYSTVDGDVWDCGSCGRQWTVAVDEPRVDSRRRNHTREVVDVVRRALCEMANAAAWGQGLVASDKW